MNRNDTEPRHSQSYYLSLTLYYPPCVSLLPPPFFLVPGFALPSLLSLALPTSQSFLQPLLLPFFPPLLTPPFIFSLRSSSFPNPPSGFPPTSLLSLPPPRVSLHPLPPSLFSQSSYFPQSLASLVSPPPPPSLPPCLEPHRPRDPPPDRLPPTDRTTPPSLHNPFPVPLSPPPQYSSCPRRNLNLAAHGRHSKGKKKEKKKKKENNF